MKNRRVPAPQRCSSCDEPFDRRDKLARCVWRGRGRFNTAEGMRIDAKDALEVRKEALCGLCWSMQTLTRLVIRSLVDQRKADARGT